MHYKIYSFSANRSFEINEFNEFNEFNISTVELGYVDKGMIENEDHFQEFILWNSLKKISVHSREVFKFNDKKYFIFKAEEINFLTHFKSRKNFKCFPGDKRPYLQSLKDFLKNLRVVAVSFFSEVQKRPLKFNKRFYLSFILFMLLIFYTNQLSTLDVL